MRLHHTVMLKTVLLILVSTNMVSAQNQSADADVTPNAAVVYWQAFAMLPTLDENQTQLLENWQSAPLDAKALQLIDASRSSRMLLHRATKISYCDWALDYNDGIGLLMPHLSKARDLARLTALHARHAFEEGDHQAAAQDAHALMILGRHVGRDPIMISVLVRYLIEGTVVDLVAPHIPRIKAPHADSVAIFQSLPAEVPLSRTILSEKQFMALWLINHLKQAEQKEKGSWKVVWKQILGISETEDPIMQVAEFDEAVRMLEDLLPAYDRLAAMVELPRDEFEARYPEFVETTRASNPLAGSLLPALDKVLAQEQRHRARIAMVLAAIAVAKNGPDELKAFPDPFGAGPFEYSPLDNGFQLRSALKFEGQPVTLTVGQ